MTDWSKVGRRSRRKGKKFEQLVARSLSEATGRRFTSTRNSGRTDLKGDVYDVDNPSGSVIECKDRGLSIKSLITGCKWLEAAVRKTEREAAGAAAIVFAKADGLVFAHCPGYNRPPAGSFLIHHWVRGMSDCEVTDVHGRVWWRVVIGRKVSPSG